MRSILIFICLCLAVVNFTQSQELPEIIPPNPEAAALGKYGDIPVGYFTGVPGISIPLVTLQGREINVPVSLSYHASGIRVNEIASRVGLGWSLVSGGTITRSMRGLPDDTNGGGYIHTTHTVDELLNWDQPQHYVNGSNSELMSDLHDAQDGYTDYESDIYNFNVMGYSGKFFFNQYGDILVHPNDDVKIEEVFDGNTIKGWKLTVKDGTVFYFGLSKDQTVQATDLSTPTSTSQISGGGFSFPDIHVNMSNYISTWHLMEINTPSGEVISFSYDSANTEFWNLSSQRKYFGQSGGGTCIPATPLLSYSISTEVTHRITSVESSLGSIDFQYNHPRTDLKNDFALTGVILYNQNNDIISQYELNYGYFTSVNHLSNSTFGDLDQRRERLYLSDVVQIKGGQTNAKHQFIYNTDHILPDRFSFSQDAWGYYNGQSNSFFYPTVKWRIGDAFFDIPGGDRKVYQDYAKACMLEKIIYPTGGSTEFEFESNRTLQLSPFFASTPLEQEVIYSYHSSSMAGNEIELIVPITNMEDYIGGFTWSVDIDQDCADPNGLDCPYAELYKGNDLTPLYVSGGSDSEQFFVFNGGEEQQVRIKIFNYSDMFGPVNEIQVDIRGYKLEPGAEIADLAGGLRVKQIINKDKDGTVASSRHYQYTAFDSSVSSGQSLYPPTFIYENKLVCTVEPSESPFRYANELVSNSIFPLNNGGSSSVGYTHVTEFFDELGDMGKIEYIFMHALDPGESLTNIFQTDDYPNTPAHDFSHRRGPMLSKKTYRKNHLTAQFEMVEEIFNTYNPPANNDQSSKNVVAQVIGSYGFHQVYTNLAEPFYKTSESKTTYSDGQALTQTTDYSYDPYPGRNFPVETQTTNALGEIRRTKTYYPDDINALTGLQADEIAAINQLNTTNQHRIATPVQMETYKIDELGNEQLMATQRTLYKDWGTGLILPEKIAVSKGQEALEDHINYHDYDAFGNPLQVSRENGIPISYIWGYHNTKPIAKLDGTAYSDIDPTTISNLQLLSDNDQDATSEQSLRDALNGFRNAYPNATFTGFTYDPLVGMSSTIDNRGYVSFFSYDDFNRLVNIKDTNSNITESFNYHYAQEAIQYAPLLVAIDYGSDDTDHQWFTANVSEGSGDYSYAWFEGIGDSSVNFEANASGTNDTYQLMVNCSTTKYVKLIVTDNITGEATEQTKVANNGCNYAPFSVSIGYGVHNDNSQNFTSNVSGGSGNYSYSWHKGVGTSSFNFEVSATSTLPNCLVIVSCTTYKWVKLVITDNITGETVYAIKQSANSPCAGGGGNPIGPDPFDPEQ